MRILLIIILLSIFIHCGKGLRHRYTLSDDITLTITLGEAAHVLWHKKLKAEIHSTYTLNDSLLLIGDSRGGVTVLDVTNGKTIDAYWKPFKRPVQLYGRHGVKFLFSSKTDKEIIAWDLEKAAKAWQKKFEHDYDEMITIDSTLYFKSDSVLVKMLADDGTVFRSHILETPHVPGFFCVNNAFFICSQNGVLKFYDHSLQLVDKYNVQLQLVEKMLRYGDNILIYNTSGEIRVFSLERHLLIYQNSRGKTLYSSPLLIHDQIIIPYANGELESRSLDSDSLNWRFSFKSLINLSPIRMNDSVYFTTARGEVICLALSTGIEQWRFDLEKSVHFVAPVANGVILAHRKEIFLIGDQNE